MRSRLTRVALSDRRVEATVVAALLLIAAIAGLLLIGHGQGLDWDESFYAVVARSLATGSRIAVDPAYRPPGLSVVGILAAPVGFGDVAVRCVSLALGILALASAWLLGRVTLGVGTALVGLAGAIVTTVVLRELPLFHNDLAAAGLALLVMAVLWRELEQRDEPTLRVLAVAPLSAAAFYLRYGIAAALLGIACVAVLLWWRVILRHRVLVLGLLASTIVLLVPHFARAMALTGRPWGVIALAAHVTDKSTPLATAKQFVQWLPARLAGNIGLVLLVAAAVLVGALVIRRLAGRNTLGIGRPVTWLIGTSILTAAATIVVSHPEPRYLLLPLLLAELVGAHAVLLAFVAIAHRMRDDPRGRQRLVVAGAAGLVIVAGAVVAYDVRHAIRGFPTRAWIRDLGLAVRDQASQPCAVATTLVAQMEWYSGCTVVSFDRRVDALTGFPGDSHWVVRTTLDVAYAGAEAVRRWEPAAAEPPVAHASGPHNSGAVYVAAP